MRKLYYAKLPCLCLIILSSFIAVFAQKSRPVKTTLLPPKPTIVFAVTNDGKNIEPIAYIQNGSLKPISDDNAEADDKAKFVKTFYPPKMKYNLIFGGATAGTVSIVKNLADTECAANQADVSIISKSVKPKGFVMALATNALPKKTVKGMRELPTSAERVEIEKLVMAEMMKENIPIKKVNELRYHNLTKVDVDNDANPEFVGTFWYNTGDNIRSLMFFIAEKNAEGFSIPFKKFDRVEIENVMSGDISDVDKGFYHELLIDIFDSDGDGKGEIFTMTRGFEGNSFNAYERSGGKWTQILETSNYHCAY